MVTFICQLGGCLWMRLEFKSVNVEKITLHNVGKGCGAHPIS